MFLRFFKFQIGTGLACGSLLCSALIVIITRKIRKVHFTVMTIVFGVIGVAQALILIYFFGTFNMPTEWFDSLLVAGIASLSWLGQMSIVLALKFEQAGRSINSSNNENNVLGYYKDSAN